MVQNLGHEMLVFVGLKDLARLPNKELGDQSLKTCNIAGIRRDFLVSKILNDGTLVLSLKAMYINKSWNRANMVGEQKGIIELNVVERCKGGYRLQMGDLMAYLPRSLVHPSVNFEISIGDRLPVKLIEVNQSKKRLICSNREALIEDSSIRVDISSLEVGDIVEGYVNNITKFGAFMDLGTNTGLLHISQISSERITSIHGVFNIGEKIKSMVLAVDRESGRISLTTKKLEPYPGDMLRNRGEVMLQAEDMAKQFRQRISAAEKAIGYERKL